MAQGVTNLAQLLNPQVIGEFLDVKLINAIKLSPLVEIDRTLEGVPGSKLTLPKFGYIGDASDLAEGGELTFDQLTETTVEVAVKKVAKGVKITDEAVLSGYGDPVNEIGKQLLMAVASKVEADLYNAVKTGSTAKVTGATFAKENIVDMKAKFGEDIEEAMYLFVNSADYAKLCKDKDFVQIANGAQVISGQVGMLYGVNIVVADRVEKGKPFLMKAGALSLIMKRNVMVEMDRDMAHFSTAFAVSDHYVAYLKYADRIVKFETTPGK